MIGLGDHIGLARAGESARFFPRATPRGGPPATEKFLGPECDIEKSETDIQKIQCGIQFFSVSDSAR